MPNKAAIYDPYLDTLGGGERYILTVAEILLKNGYQVDIFWSGNHKLIEQAQQRFSLDLSKLNIIPDVFGIKPQHIDLFEEKQNLFKLINRSLNPKKANRRIFSLLEKYKITRKYDLMFYLSDGSVPFLFSKKNILHVQVPFVPTHNIQKTISDFIKFRLIKRVICNSKFTAKFQNQAFKDKVTVLYPPVDIEKFYNNPHKQNTILSVGRFDNILNAKKQDVLIDAFKMLVESENIKDWRLVLAGGSLSEPSKNSYLQCLKEKAEGLPVDFIINPNFNELKDIYSTASIYWHAAGFDVDENKYPQNTEHFGITIVEAISSGLVPVVVNKGGIPEIVKNGVSGYLWNSIDELVSYTNKLINNQDLIKSMSQESQSLCQKFSKEQFEEQFMSIITNKT